MSSSLLASFRPMAHSDVDRNVLFGLLALRVGLIDHSAWSIALQSWSANKSRGLAEVLVAIGALTTNRRDLIEALVREHVAAHGDDTTLSLASVPADRSTLDALDESGDPDLEATVEFVGTNSKNGHRRHQAGGPGGGASTPGSRRFRVLRPHQKGGLGEVSYALDRELNREVALKQILAKHADDPIAQARFLLEAEITGGLEHPGIVPIYSLGTFDDGRPYYAMRFIRGESLKDAIANFHDGETEGLARSRGSRELGLRKLLGRFVDVCNAIEYAHRRGVIHRDLKPSNVMVGNYGETLVVDWGLGKALGKPQAGEIDGEPIMAPSHSSGTIETVPGSAIGTPSYMSPEQAAGKTDRIGTRSDIYSLGATLYSLLTGHSPFEGPDSLSVILAVQIGKFKAPREREPSVDRALEAICLKAMAHAPENRYPSAQALAEDLERWMADEPVVAFREPTARRLARWGRRHASAVAGTGAFLVAAVVGLAVVAWLVARHSARLEAAQLEAKAASGMAHKAVRTLLSDVARNDLLNIPQGELLRVKLAERALELYREFVKLHPENLDFGVEHARIEEQVASLYRLMAQYPKARGLYQQAIGRLDALLKLDPESVLAQDLRAYIEGRLAEMTQAEGGKDAEAAFHYREAIRGVSELHARYPEVARHARFLAMVSNDYSTILTQAGRYDEARSVLDRATEAAASFRASLPMPLLPSEFSYDYLLLPMIQTNQGGNLVKLGRGPEAEKVLLPAIEMYRSLLVINFKSADLRYLLANALMELGDAKAINPAGLGRAIGDLDEAQNLVEPLLAEYPRIAAYPKFIVSIRADRGALRLEAGRVEPAREDLTFADTKLTDRPATEPSTASSLRLQGRVKASLARLAKLDGDKARARTLAEAAVTLQQKALAINPERRDDRELLERHEALRKDLAGPGR